MRTAWSRHPAFAPYAAWLGDGAAPPRIEALNALAGARALALPDGRPLAFAEAGGGGALAYERRVAEEGVVATRPGSWHDAFNALAWLAFPRTKAALNAVHCRRGAQDTPNQRDRARDAATLLDESGLVVACEDATFAALLREHAWRELFVEREREVAHMVAVAIGHGLLDKLRRPFPAITARVLVLCAPGRLEELRDVAALDAAAAHAVAAPTLLPDVLLPLPVAALPGWDVDGRGSSRFDDRAVYRPRRARAHAVREATA
ncbi:MAG TPA: DUF3025 domain-containing protein [Casimicrobiaceae bacterium]|nr:DUF3025 domain-containing protein [Casimicrobiaceae bacterium]